MATIKSIKEIAGAALSEEHDKELGTRIYYASKEIMGHRKGSKVRFSTHNMGNHLIVAHPKTPDSDDKLVGSHLEKIKSVAAKHGLHYNGVHRGHAHNNHVFSADKDKTAQHFLGKDVR